MQSQVPIAKATTTVTTAATAARTSAKVSPLKSLLTSSALGIIMLGAVTGCQSTDGLSAPSSVTVTQPTSQTSPNPTTASDSSPVYQGIEEDYPILEVDDNTEAVAQESGFDPQPSYSVESPTESSEEPAATKDNIPNPNAVGQTRPAAPVPSSPIATNEAPVVAKPPVADAKTVQQSLLEQARQNSKKSTNRPTSIQDGSTIPAFQKLMDTGVEQLRQGQVSAAQATFTRAQRLAPQSSAVYFYLGQVALKQNQPLKAEAMARRGLVVAQTEARKRALWQIILIAGQAQGNSRVIKEAKAALSR